MFRKFLYIWIKIGAWWFFLLGLLMALMMFIELVNPRPESDPDVVLRFVGFIIPVFMSYIGFLMIKAKKLHRWESSK